MYNLKKLNISQNFYEFSKKIESFSNKYKKIFINLILYNYWINYAVKIYVMLKWAVRHFFYFMFNGFFLYLLFHGTRSNIIALKVFSYGAGIYFISRIVRMMWGAFIRFIFLIRKVKFSEEKLSPYQKYMKKELKARGIDYVRV